MVKALPFIRQPDRVARKVSDVSAADWRYQTHVEKDHFFYVCCCSLSQGWKSLYNHILYDKIRVLCVLSTYGQ